MMQQPRLSPSLFSHSSHRWWFAHAAPFTAIFYSQRWWWDESHRWAVCRDPPLPMQQHQSGRRLLTLTPSWGRLGLLEPPGRCIQNLVVRVQPHSVTAGGSSHAGVQQPLRRCECLRCRLRCLDVPCPLGHVRAEPPDASKTGRPGLRSILPPSDSA